MSFKPDDRSVESREDLAEYIEELHRDLAAGGEGWENITLPAFLEAMSVWVRAMPQVERNLGLEFDREPKWRLFAHILAAGALHE